MRSDTLISYFDSYPEMHGYLNQPLSMQAGCPGKNGYLYMRFAKDNNGKSILRDLYRRVPIIVQQALYFDKKIRDLPCVYILSSGGPNVDGDRYLQDIVLEEGSSAFISTGAATKIAEMKHNYSGLLQTFKLEANSYLEYIPEQIIPCANSRFISETKIIAEPTATIVYSEIFTAGRKYYNNGELFKFDIISVCTQGERPDGTPLFREKFVIEPSFGHIQTVGNMSRYHTFANVIVMCPNSYLEVIYQSTNAVINKSLQLAVGISRLPNNAGVLFKCLGVNTDTVKKEVRYFCSRVRQIVKGAELPEEFSWR
jgi:urease accessory protein